MTEKALVRQFVSALTSKAQFIGTEVSNFHRSADIAAIMENGEVWVVECKLSAISKAIEQLQTHMMSADKVYLGLPKKRRNIATIDKINTAGFGLLEIDEQGELCEVIPAKLRETPTSHFKKVLMNNITAVSQ